MTAAERVRAAARRHADEVVAPGVARWEKRGRFPRDAARRAARDGLLGLFAPVEAGGQGLTFAEGNSLPPAFASGAFVGQHGSWNREPHSGYKVIFVPFADGAPAGAPVDVLTGFLSDDGKALGRPVGVVIDGQGALLVADDVGNKVWRVTAADDTAS